MSFGVKEKGFKALFEVQLYLLTVRFYEDLIIGEILLGKLFWGLTIYVWFVSFFLLIALIFISAISNRDIIASIYDCVNLVLSLSQHQVKDFSYVLWSRNERSF